LESECLTPNSSFIDELKRKRKEKFNPPRPSEFGRENAPKQIRGNKKFFSNPAVIGLKSAEFSASFKNTNLPL
jgi:hypothetical protein